MNYYGADIIYTIVSVYGELVELNFFFDGNEDTWLCHRKVNRITISDTSYFTVKHLTLLLFLLGVSVLCLRNILVIYNVWKKRQIKAVKLNFSNLKTQFLNIIRLSDETLFVEQDLFGERFFISVLPFILNEAKATLTTNILVLLF